MLTRHTKKIARGQQTVSRGQRGSIGAHLSGRTTHTEASMKGVLRRAWQGFAEGSEKGSEKVSYWALDQE